MQLPHVKAELLSYLKEKEHILKTRIVNKSITARPYSTPTIRLLCAAIISKYFISILKKKSIHHLRNEYLIDSLIVIDCIFELRSISKLFIMTFSPLIHY